MINSRMGTLDAPQEGQRHRQMLVAKDVGLSESLASERGMVPHVGGDEVLESALLRELFRQQLAD